MDVGERIDWGGTAGAALRLAERRAVAVQSSLAGHAEQVWQRTADPSLWPLRMATSTLVGTARLSAAGGLQSAARTVGALSAARTGSVTDRVGTGRAGPGSPPVGAGRGARPLVNAGRAFTEGWRRNELACAGPLPHPGVVFRHGGRDLPARPMPLRFAYPDATDRLVVLLHGRGETEEFWYYRSWQHWQRGHHGYGEQLRAEHGYTPVWVRYDAALPIPVIASGLSGALAELVRSWPVPVSEVVLIGHDQGGSVLQSCLRSAGPWGGLVRSTVSLGSPHPVGQVSSRLVDCLSLSGTHLLLARWATRVRQLRLPNPWAADAGTSSTAPVDATAGSTAGTSVGTTAGTAAGTPATGTRWPGPEPRRPAAGTVRRRHLLLTTVPRYPDSLTRLGVHDLLVVPLNRPDGSDTGRFVGLPERRIMVSGGLTPLDLLNHPAVYQEVASWLTAG